MLKTSIGICADDLAAADGSQGAPGQPLDGAPDEPDGAVAEEGVDAARVVAARGDRGVGWAAAFLADGNDVDVNGGRAGQDRLVGGPGGGEAGFERRAVD